MVCLVIWLLLIMSEVGRVTSVVSRDGCSINSTQATNECANHRITQHGQRAPTFTFGGTTIVKSSFLFMVITSNTDYARAECALNLNIENIFKKLSLPKSAVVPQEVHVYITCLTPVRVTFCRQENFTANDVILYLGFAKQCRVSGTDMAVWGRAVDLRVLYLFDGVTVEENGETKADLKGLFNIGSLVLQGLKNKMIPRMFLSHVWEKMAEVQLSKLSVNESILNMLKTTMPCLQSLGLAMNSNVQVLPDFPWCNRSLELPRNLSRISVLNEQYSEGATINPRLYRRFFVVHFCPLGSTRDVRISLAGNLDKISFRGDDLKFINFTSFKVTNLKVIDLSNNKLREIPVRSFKNAPNLVEIILANNELTALNGKIFENLRFLRKLDVGSNNIHALQSGFLTEKLEHLESFNFENNSMSFVDARAFPRGVFNALKTINFRMNKLRKIPEFGFYARNLENFDVSENEINFTGFVNTINAIHLLDFVYIHIKSSSSVEATYERILINSQNKATLNLQHNRIERFDLADFNKTQLLTLEYVLKAFTLDFNENPLHCDCKMRELQIKLLNWSKTAKEITKKDFESWICHTPKELRGESILSVSPELLRCEHRNCPKCPARCTCYQKNSDSLIEVDCKRCNLTSLPEELPSGMVELHLEHNEIENLTFSRHMENVSLLYVSHNKLQRVHLKYFPSKLREIYLDSNRLATLPNDFQNLSLTRINLQNNFFTCDCNNYWMKNWLKRKRRAFIGGAQSVACSSGDNNEVKPLVFVKDSDFICTELIETDRVGGVASESIHAISAYAVAGFLFIFIVSAALLYRFRKELKLLLYTRFNWHPFDRVDDSDPSKIYDAFVSFNKRDITWVMETLRDKLENLNPPYKLCIHCRDFIPGAPIAENILDSVKTSRRMIMVLSRHFIQSEWCMLEFRAAHRRVLKGRSNYLIIVLFDDVDVDNLDDELKLYLKTNTYLSVQSKWFWQQLKYALPQKKLKTNYMWSAADEELKSEDVQA